MVRLIAFLLLLKLVGALRVLHTNTNPTKPAVKNEKILRRLLNTIIAKQLDNNNRRLNSKKIGKMEDVFKILRSKRPQDLPSKMAFRTNAEEEAEKVAENEEQEHIVETELTETLNKKSSLYMKKPYVEHKGQNDFLVMKTENEDTFVTVIPNAIYYNIEKKCTNWLDDCSLQGIRARLLNKVNYPYK